MGESGRERSERVQKWDCDERVCEGVRWHGKGWEGDESGRDGHLGDRGTRTCLGRHNWKSSLGRGVILNCVTRHAVTQYVYTALNIEVSSELSILRR